MKGNDGDYSRINAACRRFQIKQSIEYEDLHQEKRQDRKDNYAQTVFYYRPKDLEIR